MTIRSSAQVLAAALFALSMATAADATTLWAGPLYPTPGNLDCFISNVGTKPLDVAVQVLGATGSPLATGTATLSPGATTGTGSNSSGARLCKFLFKGGKNTVRATACVASVDRCDGSSSPGR